MPGRYKSLERRLEIKLALESRFGELFFEHRAVNSFLFQDYTVHPLDDIVRLTAGFIQHIVYTACENQAVSRRPTPQREGQPQPATLRLVAGRHQGQRG